MIKQGSSERIRLRKQGCPHRMWIACIDEFLQRKQISNFYEKI